MRKSVHKLVLFAMTAILTVSGFAGCGNTSEKPSTNTAMPNFTESKSFRLFADRPCTPTIENLTVYKEAGFTHYNMTEDDYQLTNMDRKFGHATGKTEMKDGKMVFVDNKGEEELWNDANGADDDVVNPKYLQAFANCEEVGLKAVLRNYYADPYYFKNETDEIRPRDITLRNATYRIPVRDVTEELKDLPAIDGYYMGDEPSWDFIDRIAPIVDYYNANLYKTGKTGEVGWFHINLLQTYGNGFFAGHTFEEYVDKYCDVILSRVKGTKSLGTDYYPLEYNVANGEAYIKNGILVDYFVLAEKTKQMNATLADSEKVLTNLCIQTFNSKNTKWRDISSLADVTFQTNLAMAFGAKSLQYYLYRATSGDGGIIDNVTQKPTVMYPWVQESNRQAQSLAPAILSFDWVGAKTYAGSQVSSENTVEGFEKVADRVMDKFAFIENVDARLDAVVSEMQDKSGNKAYMLVNFSEPSLGQSNYVTLNFVSGVKKALVYIDGEPQTMDVVNGKLQIKLGAGGGAFVYPVQ
jgi:hypothetical protein